MKNILSITISRSKGSIENGIIKEFEKKINKNLPELYIEFICANDGAYPIDNMFTYIDHTTNKEDGNGFVFLSFDVDGFDTIFDKVNLFEDFWDINDIIPFGVTGNGDYLGFDYRKDPSSIDPSVVVVIHDDVDENGDFLICQVAPNFEHLIRHLKRGRTDEEMEELYETCKERGWDLPYEYHFSVDK